MQLTLVEVTTNLGERLLMQGDHGHGYSCSAGAGTDFVMAKTGTLMPWLDAHRRGAMVAVLLLAALLRVQQLNQPYIDGYAWREADTASIAAAFAGGAWNIFLPQVRWGGPGPNYIGAEFQTVGYLAALGYRVFGQAPWVGRAVAIAFGLWGVFALYQLVRRVWGTSNGIAAAAVMAVLPGSVFIERSFLPDGAMTALMITSLWMLVAYCQTEKQRYLVAAAIAGTLGCLTKLPGGILVLPAVYAVTSILGPRLADRRLQTRLGIAALLTAAPVIAYYLWARHVASGNPPFHFTGAGKFLWNSDPGEWLHSDYFLPQFWQIVSRELWGLPFIALAVVGGARPPRTGEPHRAPWLFHAWLVAMLIRYLFEANHLVTDPYNIHLFNPAIAALAGGGLLRLADGVTPFRTWQPRAALAALLFAGSTVVEQVQTQQLFAAAYRDHYVLAQLVARLSQPRDLVISMGLEPVVLYHSQRNGWVFPPDEIANMNANSRAFVPDHGYQDVAILHGLRAQGGQWLAIPSWNSYTGASGQEFLRQQYPVLYAGIVADFAVVSELPEGLILHAR